MRIISNFKDYYDGFMDHDRKDPFIKIWTRRKEEVLVSKYDVECFKEKGFYVYQNRMEAGFIVLAGKVIPFIYHMRYDDYPPYRLKDTFYYSYDEIAKEFQNLPVIQKENLKDLFKEYPDMTRLCLQFQTPLLLINMNRFKNWTNPDSTNRTIFTNPNLKEMQFSKIMSAPQLYQILDYFVSNIMVSDKDPHGVQTDIQKVEAHGFDKVRSFRNMPRC